MVAGLFLSDTAPLWAELPVGLGPVSYSALFPAGRHIIEWRTRDECNSGRYTIRLDRTTLPEPDEPAGVSAMPRDGLISGLIGGFDNQDRIFLPLPVGSGAKAIACRGSLLNWEVVTYGDETLLIRGDPTDAVVIPYGPDLGGAVELRIAAAAGTAQGPYDCHLRFAPGAPGAATTTMTHDEAADDASPTEVVADAKVQGRFESDRDIDRITVAVASGEFARLRCHVDVAQMQSDGALRHALAGGKLPDGTPPFLAEDAPSVLELRPLAEAPFPVDWACDLIADGRFSTPAAMGLAPHSPATTNRGPTLLRSTLPQPYPSCPMAAPIG